MSNRDRQNEAGLHNIRLRMHEFKKQKCHSRYANENWCIEWFWPSIGALIVFIIITLVFTYLFMEYAQFSLIESIYFTLYTIATIGYGDLSLNNDTSKWIAVILIYISSTWLMALFTHLIETCLKGSTKYSPCDENRNCRCKFGLPKDNNHDEPNVHFGILAKIDEYIEDDEYYKQLKLYLYKSMKIKLGLIDEKKQFTNFIQIFMGKDNDLETDLSILNDIEEEHKHDDTTFEMEMVTQNLTADYDQIEWQITNKQIDNKKQCCSGWCNLSCCCFNKHLCKSQTLWYFICVTLIYGIWFTIWMVYFTNKTYGTTKFSLTDAFYFGVVSSSSVGYGDFSAYGNDDINNTITTTKSPIIIIENIYNNSNYTFIYNYTTSNFIDTNHIEFIEGDYGDNTAIFIAISSIIGFVIFITWVGIISQLYLNCLHWCIYKCCCDKKDCCCKYGKCQTIYDERLKHKTNRLLKYYKCIADNPDRLFNKGDILPKYHSPKSNELNTFPSQNSIELVIDSNKTRKQNDKKGDHKHSGNIRKSSNRLSNANRDNKSHLGTKHSHPQLSPVESNSIIEQQQHHKKKQLQGKKQDQQQM